MNKKHFYIFTTIYIYILYISIIGKKLKYIYINNYYKKYIFSKLIDLNLITFLFIHPLYISFKSNVN